MFEPHPLHQGGEPSLLNQGGYGLSEIGTIARKDDNQGERKKGCESGRKGGGGNLCNSSKLVLFASFGLPASSRFQKGRRAHGDSSKVNKKPQLSLTKLTQYGDHSIRKAQKTCQATFSLPIGEGLGFFAQELSQKFKVMKF